MRARWPSLLSWATLSLAVAFACGGGSSSNGGGSGSSATSGGTGATSGMTGGASGSGGQQGSSGATSGVGATGSAGGTGATAGSSGQVATGGDGSGAAAGSSGIAGGSGGSGAAKSGASTSGSAGSGSGASGSAMPFPTGMSMGCGNPPPSTDKTTGYVEHELALTTCPGKCNWPCDAGTTGCATDPEPPTCVSPCFAPGGIASVTSTDGAHNFVKRNYGVQLPTNYDPTKAYPVMLKGGGCDDPSPAGGFYVAQAATENAAMIAIGLQFVDATKDDAGNLRGEYQRCFADGASVCTALPQNLPLCVNNPEIAYVNAVIADVEAKYCVSKDQIFIGGYSSGAWEAMTMGCALADEIRGIATVFGGLRLHRPACDGPVAALMVTGTADSTNPIGPLVADMPYPPTGAPLLTATAVDATIGYLDSLGSAPERDDILNRNGCLGTSTAMYDPGYPQCLKYTGCPANYPVVWCPLIGVSHGYELATSNGVNYVFGSNANPLLLGFLKSLPPL
jgi:hypothetical protein